MNNNNKIKREKLYRRSLVEPIESYIKRLNRLLFFKTKLLSNFFF